MPPPWTSSIHWTPIILTGLLSLALFLSGVSNYWTPTIFLGLLSLAPFLTEAPGDRRAPDWRRLKLSGTDPALAFELAANVARVRRALFEGLTVRGQLLQASPRNKARPFTPEQWFSFASQTIDALLALQHRAARLAAALERSVLLRTAQLVRSGAKAASDV